VQIDLNAAESSVPTGTERRLAAALDNLPEPFPTTRERPASDALSRHAAALRNRLDFLVSEEDELGERQRNFHRRRAERNALVWVLTQLIPGRNPEKPEKPLLPSRDT
jgi:hypothetical protein